MNYNDIEYWYNQVLNIIPIQFKNKNALISWEVWQDKIIPKDIYEKWKKDYKNCNWTIITGNNWRGIDQGKYLCCIDIDNKKGVNDTVTIGLSNTKIRQLILWEAEN
jgi:hypothetical protein